jgi:hypothetical protein
MAQTINGSIASYISKINSGAEWVDTQFNRVNTIPIVGTFTSSIYATASVVHFLGAGIFSMIGFVGQLHYGKDSSFKLIADAGSEHMQHAVLNYVCALGTGSLAGSLLGWAPLIGYQISQHEDICKLKPKADGFKPFVKYGTPIRVQINEIKTRVQKAITPAAILASCARCYFS